MKIKLTLLLLLFSGILLHAQDNPFLKLTYDSVVIYDFESRGKTTQQLSIVSDSNTLASDIKKASALSTGESQRLSERIGQKESYGQGVAACFDPHLGIVYYKNGKHIAYITVCIDCNRLESSLEIQNQKQGKQVSDEGDEFYTAIGMSKQLRKHLNHLLKKYGFSHTIKGKATFMI